MQERGLSCLRATGYRMGIQSLAKPASPSCAAARTFTSLLTRFPARSNQIWLSVWYSIERGRRSTLTPGVNLDWSVPALLSNPCPAFGCNNEYTRDPNSFRNSRFLSAKFFYELYFNYISFINCGLICKTVLG